ncbi:hypothetical protein [Parasitella parasitica]|uniref:Uncharacterized protein n=1 Tax=Parasitella parasitica TaxID=35722 RepID=A0A0B7NK22_9FUNG|nr:hypothetical protein [Parasitella parasitica]
MMCSIEYSIGVLISSIFNASLAMSMAFTRDDKTKALQVRLTHYASAKNDSSGNYDANGYRVFLDTADKFLTA